MLLIIIPITFFIAPVLTGNETTTTEQITSITPDNDQSSENNEQPLDAETHPNLELLPKDCGFITSQENNETKTLPSEMPWMVLLSYNTVQGRRLGCVGTLINERHVLTAAQCVTFLGNSTLESVILGEYDVRTDPDCSDADEPICNSKVQIVTVEEVIPHPGYSLGGSRQAFADDIAIVRLATPANFSNGSVGPLCLPVTAALRNQSIEDSPEGMVAGWNLNGFKLLSPVLEKTSVSIITNEECQLAYNNGTSSNPPLISSKHICLKNHAGGDDPGGPLMFPGAVESAQRYIQHGIVSFGPTRRGSQLPEVYTRVAHYITWILDNLK